MENRTDLALESYENQRKTALPGVKVREQDGISVVEVLDARGEKALGKPVGKYITYRVSPMAQETQLFDGRLEGSPICCGGCCRITPPGYWLPGWETPPSLRMRWGRRPTAMCWPPVTLPENCAGRWDH